MNSDYALELSFSDKRFRIQNIMSSINDSNKLIEELAKEGIQLLKYDKEIGKGDCQSWAFDQIGLPWYRETLFILNYFKSERAYSEQNIDEVIISNIRGAGLDPMHVSIANLLKNDLIPELKPVKEFEEDLLVLYYFSEDKCEKYNSFKGINHYGITRVVDQENLVESRWGKNEFNPTHVYLHQVDKIPIILGDKYQMFRKIK